MKPDFVSIVVIVAAACGACNATRPVELRDPAVLAAPLGPIGAAIAPADGTPIAPPPVVERPGPAPDQPAIWVPGHWSWSGRGVFLWVRGVWALKHTSFEPPPARAETPPPPPSRGMFWAPGAWMYRGNDFLWIAGHWERTRPGFVHVAPHWEPDGNKWRFVEEHWQPG